MPDRELTIEVKADTLVDFATVRIPVAIEICGKTVTRDYEVPLRDLVETYIVGHAGYISPEEACEELTRQGYLGMELGWNAVVHAAHGYKCGEHRTSLGDFEAIAIAREYRHRSSLFLR